jgi:formylglycine-generating enzyme required for sulfatase activity
MSKFEVTGLLWDAVMGDNTARENTSNSACPVKEKYYRCRNFVDRLNALPEVKKAGLVFFIPSADDWEYACRAGATGDYCKLDDGREITMDSLAEVAWCSGSTHPVGQKKPNAFGLYDMIGNVSEWTDSFVNGNRVSCGGGATFFYQYYKASDRLKTDSHLTDDNGIRLCAKKVIEQ